MRTEVRKASVRVGGQPVRPLAESPRKVVFESPRGASGEAGLTLNEKGVESKGPFRNVGVRLSAPKTNLTRGEQTALKVAVSGLEGIKENVPLRLDTTGSVRMDGGNTQTVQIAPSAVGTDGTYTTTRTITGQQAGPFTVTATVLT